MNFASDNALGAAPEILEALAKANHDAVPSYGEDPYTTEAEKALQDIFECKAKVFLVATGTAANSLSLSVLTPPYGAVLTHEASHIQVDECGAPELYTGGAKLIPLRGDNGKVTPEAVVGALRYLPPNFVHHVQASAVSVTQASECGTVYTPDELAALKDAIAPRNMALHMDGARFANALVHLGCSPAEATWKSGVDVLVFGATKNGALACEAVVFFDPEKAADFEFRRKRAGHLISKGRFLGAQMAAYLKDGLWLKLAAHANAMASRLAKGLEGVEGISRVYPVEANEVFAEMSQPLADSLLAAGAKFYPWVVPGDPSDGRMFRMVTSFASSEAQVDAFCRAAQSARGRL